MGGIAAQADYLGALSPKAGDLLLFGDTPSHMQAGVKPQASPTN